MTDSQQPDPVHPQIWRAVISSSLGNALEWFDVIIYGTFAVTIAKLYFPTADPTVSLLITFATFGVAFFMRPLGAVILGSYSDRAGRKAALTLSILLMTIGTLVIAITPTYQTIGIWAPIAIVLARLLQGFSAGGEFGSATAFLVEHAPHRRGFFSSWQFASQGLSMLLAALFGAALFAWTTPQQFDAWGWRIPFVFGLLIGPAGYYIRKHLDESPGFIAAGGAAAPLRSIFSGQKDRILIGTGCVVMCTIGNYTILYLPTYAARQLALSSTEAFGAMIVAGLTLALVTPVLGHYSDKIGRTPFMIISSILFALLTFPLFYLLTSHPDFLHLMLVQAVLALLLALFNAPMSALLSEMFPVQTRGTGMSLSYNIAVMIFGGFAGMTITWLIALTGNKLAICFYVIGGALVSIVATLAARYRLQLR